jgi:hypothetical protein
MVFMQLVHEPKQAKCCNHALIPICNTPMVGRRNFILLKNSRPPFGVSNPILLIQGFPAMVTMLRTELRTGGYTSPKFLWCSLVEATGPPRGSDSIGSSCASELQTSGVLDSPDSDSTGLQTRGQTRVKSMVHALVTAND